MSKNEYFAELSLAELARINGGAGVDEKNGANNQAGTDEKDGQNNDGEN